MNIWNTVFLTLALILAVVVGVFTSQEMLIRKAWNESITAHEKKIVEHTQLIEKTLHGTDPLKKPTDKAFNEMSMDELKLKLHELVFERKRAWFGCRPGNIDAAGATLTPQQLGNNHPATPAEKLKPINLVEVKLTIVGPVVTKDGKEEVIPPDDLSGVVYLFDEGSEGVGGAFLGRFTVKGVEKTANGYQVVLHAANELNEGDVTRIQKTLRSTWAIYTSMPTDRFFGLFDRLSPDDADKLIPKPLRESLMKSDRQLRDFDELMNVLNNRRVDTLQQIDQSKRAIEKNNESLEIANKEEQSLRADGDMTKKRIAAMEDQRKVLQTKVDEFDAMIKSLNEQIDATQKQNQWYVAQIAGAQLKASEAIEKRAEAARSEQ